MKTILIMIMFVFGTTAHAGFFDDVKDAVDTTFSDDGADAINDAFDDAGDKVIPEKEGSYGFDWNN